MDFPIPKSMVHATAELKSCIESHREMQIALKEQDKYVKKVDTKQMFLYQCRIQFLRKWIKSQESGKEFPCRNCSVLEYLYAKLKAEGMTEPLMLWLHDVIHGKDTRLKALPKEAEALQAEISRKWKEKCSK